MQETINYLINNYDFKTIQKIEKFFSSSFNLSYEKDFISVVEKSDRIWFYKRLKSGVYVWQFACGRFIEDEDKKEIDKLIKNLYRERKMERIIQ